jgi:hypothetical protein
MQAYIPIIPIPEPKFDFAGEHVPKAPLESLRFKLTQTIDSIQALHAVIQWGNTNTMPPWPEIMSKYTLLLSQSHSLMSSLAGLTGGGTATADGRSVFGTLALHLKEPMSEMQMDAEIANLIRNAQTLDVRTQETKTVRGIASHMNTRGALGLMPPGGPPPNFPPNSEYADTDGRRGRKPTEEEVIRECEEMRMQHDARAERAIRAVAMLREKFDLKARLQVDQEEPEELDWDPRTAGGMGAVAPGARHGEDGDTNMQDEDDDDDDDDDDEDEEEDGSSEGDENGVDEALGLGMTPGTSPMSFPPTPAMMEQ